MFVVLAADPSVDRVIEVDRLERGVLHWASAGTVRPCGRGVHLARALAGNGFGARVVVPAGGPDGDNLVSLLRAEDIEVIRVRTEAAVRRNIRLVEPDATVTRVNEIGPRLSGNEVRVLCDALVKHVDDARWVVLAGRTPRGMDPETLAEVVARLTGAGVKVTVDSSGSALVEAVKAGPALVKLNLEELESATSRQLTTFADVADAAQQLRSLGAGAVLAGFGAKGAVLVEDTGTWRAKATPARPVSTIGAGDALLAGFLSAGAEGIEALGAAVRWAAAAVSLPGSVMPGPVDIEARERDVDASSEWDEKVRG
ncbi:1-phosphofructokinase [Amycolatopsis sp. WAC 04169]|uniref:1-phosphofructokinase family hexose kinase n=1 Tax=Amycolatopsis sp. WAC 04169 TaxID=2203197 RepID=UPI000F77911E|nr:1-phosphofructokinase family hexose kinase [Amycolatopsis sp. WAC 04169]RSN19305.1 1-phosphofructokinase [Amycolatopsis sp. WAC 04169]